MLESQARSDIVFDSLSLSRSQSISFTRNFPFHAEIVQRRKKAASAQKKICSFQVEEGKTAPI